MCNAPSNAGGSASARGHGIACISCTGMSNLRSFCTGKTPHCFLERQCCHIGSICTKSPSWCERELLVQLQNLNLSSNALSGSLPEAWGKLTSVSLLLAWLVNTSLYIRWFSKLQHVSIAQKPDYQRPQAPSRPCMTVYSCSWMLLFDTLACSYTRTHGPYATLRHLDHPVAFYVNNQHQLICACTNDEQQPPDIACWDVCIHSVLCWEFWCPIVDATVLLYLQESSLVGTLAVVRHCF